MSTEFHREISREYNRLRRLAFATHMKEVHQRYYKRNHERICRLHRINCKSRYRSNFNDYRTLTLARRHEWIKRNPEKIRSQKIQWRKNNRQKFLEQCRRHYLKHRKTIRDKHGEWKRQNPLYFTLYQRQRIRNDPTFRLVNALRCRIREAIKGNSKSSKSLNLLGCPIEDLWIYLESKFEEGMTRDNYGKVWHIDHIMPCAIFDLSKPEHQKRCFHFSNLQPLFGKDNLSKGAKVMTNQFQLL
jgi:hypothetical protein